MFSLQKINSKSIKSSQQTKKNTTGTSLDLLLNETQESP